MGKGSGQKLATREQGGQKLAGRAVRCKAMATPCNCTVAACQRIERRIAARAIQDAAAAAKDNDRARAGDKTMPNP